LILVEPAQPSGRSSARPFGGSTAARRFKAERGEGLSGSALAASPNGGRRGALPEEKATSHGFGSGE